MRTDERPKQWASSKIDLDQKFLCHPDYWDMEYVLKYLKNMGIDPEPSTLRKKCIKGEFDAQKGECEKRGKLIWYVRRTDIIKFSKTYKRRKNIRH